MVVINDIWPNTSNRFVAYFDIMGFKDFVYRNTHEIVGTQIMDVIAGISKDINYQGWDLDFFQNIKSTLFSDTLLFISKGDSTLDCSQILNTSQMCLFRCFSNNIPIKGGISLGLFTANFDKNVFYGKPLIDSYNLVDDLHMYGCIIDNLVEKFVNENLKSENLSDCNLIKYKAPFKFGQAKHYFLNWCDRLDIIENCRSGRSSNSFIDEFYYRVSGQPRVYIDNTIDFISYCTKKTFM
jgi:hypothetical protein